jgi:hypothetical protein
MKVVLRNVEDHGDNYMHCYWWCPGCDQIHTWQIGSAKGPNWEWNGDLEKPTVSPSILTTFQAGPCHVFIRDGVIDFLSDCWHKLAGQQVPMVDVPDWVAA